ncbi:hypothetical protein KAF25_004471 [Fusarium avenaceum]|uniref:Uncharacterized protein n=1 Tax=Fusarium avenaceum TaxID=40199 RepID=A0A9P7HCF0_9HYPO|nr:hypothetical protein KAF25_004471 [Fusarium avenaceum]
MMTTSMGPSFSGHPAGMGHPGVAGHPMGPGGMPHNPGQQGAPGGMPHQFGGPMVSAPGAQVNPALMGGMPPGANPNAHALQHLNPAAQQQMLQQQLQQQHFNNPQAMAAMRQQQQQLLHQQQARQLMAQQAFQANMQGGVPMNMAQFSQLNPQQIHQLRRGMGGPHQMSAAAAQQMAIQSQILQQQRRDSMKGQCLLKLMQFSEHLSGFPGSKGRDDLSYWNGFVMRFFSPNGVFRHSLHITDAEDTADKQYEIAYPAIARYFHTHFGSGVKNMQLIMDKGVTDRPLPGDCHCIENSKASLVYWFETGSHLVASGTLRAQFDAEQKIELFEFLTTSHDEFISRKQVIDAAKPAHMWMKDWHKTNSQDGKSPELSKKGKGRQLKSPQTQPPEVLVDLPDSAVNSKGVTEAVFQFLEIVEVMGQMNPLFQFYHSNPGLGPYQALDQYVSTNINGLPPNMNGQQMPPGARTPSFGQFPMGASPAAAHMNLPGSPHMGSPAQGHMQAPGMQMQQSQQGTGSSGPSANTSPASNKRRRPSAVKDEDISGAPTPNTNGMTRNAKPPTPRMPKRLKGNPPAQ